MESIAGVDKHQSELPSDSIDPVIASVLMPGERVYWQGQYVPKRLGAIGSLLMTGAVAGGGSARLANYSRCLRSCRTIPTLAIWSWFWPQCW